MAFADYSLTPSSNTSIAGISIAEGCPAANINNAIRQFMADARALNDALPVTANYVLKDGSVQFTGQPLYNGRGAFLHMASSANASAKVTVQASGGAAPSMADGDWLVEY